MGNIKNIIIGFLVLVIASASIFYISMNDVRMRVDNDKTTFYIYQNGRWLISGTEYLSIFNGTSKLNRNVSGIKIEQFIDEANNILTIRKTTPYQKGPIIVQTYTFYGNIDDKELFPVSHKVEVFNAEGLFLRYEVENLVYSGPTYKLVSEIKLYFGRNMIVNLNPVYRWAWVYSIGKVSAQYGILSDYEKYSFRLYDPTENISQCTVITANNTVYDLTASFSNSTANVKCMDFSGPVFNTTLDCHNYNINGTTGATTYGIYILRTSITNTNITIQNCNLTNWYNAIYLSNSTNNMVVNNTINNTGSISVYLLASSSNNNFTGNTVNYSTSIAFYLTANSNNTIFTNNTAFKCDFGFRISSSHNNTFNNNTVMNSTTSGYYLDNRVGNNNVTGGTFIYNPSDFRLATASGPDGATNYFKKVDFDFTSSIVVRFEDEFSIFNYLGDDTSLQLSTNYVVAAVKSIRRILNSWNQRNISWNDSVTVTTGKFNYTLYGLVANANYTVYNFSSLVYTLNSTSTGTINFTIVLNTTSRVIQVNNTADTTSPTYNSSGTNNTNPVPLSAVLHYANWHDETGLSGYIFSWNATGATCTDGMTNDTWVVMTGLNNWSNVTKTVPLVCAGKVIDFLFYTNDTSNNWNKTTDITETEGNIVPTYSLNGTNNSNPFPYSQVLFHVKWNDGSALSGYIFSWNATGTTCSDGFTNDTWVPMLGVTNWSNVTNQMPFSCQNKTIGFLVYANNTNNNWNSTIIDIINENSISLNYTSHIIILNNTNDGIIEDTSVYSHVPTYNYGNRITMFVGRRNSIYDYHDNAFMTWDLLVVPTVAQNITNANLSLDIYATYGIDLDVAVYNTSLYNSTGNGPWVEGTLLEDYCDVACDITQNLTWSTMPIEDVLQDNISSVPISGNELYWNVTNAAITSFANTSDRRMSIMLKNGTYLNTIGYVWFYTKETKQSYETPNLIITYNMLEPIITIQFPINITYAFGDDVWSNVTLAKEGLWCGVNNDTNNMNLTMVNSSGNWNYKFIGMAKGTHNMTFYCSDTTGSLSYSETIYFNIVDSIPTYSANSTNSTVNGMAVQHNLKWTDIANYWVNMSGYIFSFDNCTGTLVNDTWVSMTGATNWSNVTKVINSTIGCSINWCVYANDSKNNWNTSCDNMFSYLTHENTYTVCSSGCDSTTIQGAAGMLVEYGTVIVIDNRTYNESITLNKIGITLTSNSTPIINGAISITSNNVYINNINISGGVSAYNINLLNLTNNIFIITSEYSMGAYVISNWYSTIYLYNVTNSTISNNTINNLYAMPVRLVSSSMLTFSNNIVNGHAMNYYESNNSIVIQNQTALGFTILLNCNNTTMSNNTIMDTIVNYNSSYLQFTNNSFPNITSVGLFLIDNFDGANVSYNNFLSPSSTVFNQATANIYLANEISYFMTDMYINGFKIHNNNITNIGSWSGYAIIKEIGNPVKKGSISNNIIYSDNLPLFFNSFTDSVFVNNTVTSKLTAMYLESGTPNVSVYNSSFYCYQGGAYDVCFYDEGQYTPNNYYNVNITTFGKYGNGYTGGMSFYAAARNQIFDGGYINITYNYGIIMSDNDAINNSITNAHIEVYNATGIRVYGTPNNSVINSTIIHHGTGYDFYILGNTTSNSWFNITNTTFNHSNIYVGSTNITTYVKNYLDVRVIRHGGAFFSGVNITITDVYGNPVYTGLTDANGQISTQILTEFLANGTYSTTTGYYYYTNYTINATKSGYETSTTSLNLTSSTSLIITMLCYSPAGTSINMELPPSTSNWVLNTSSCYPLTGVCYQTGNFTPKNQTLTQWFWRINNTGNETLNLTFSWNTSLNACMNFFISNSSSYLFQENNATNINGVTPIYVTYKLVSGGTISLWSWIELNSCLVNTSIPVSYYWDACG